MILTGKTKPEAVSYIGKVNLLTDLLFDIDDFDMTFSDSENTINSVITDKENDIAKIYLNGEVICEYVYGGFSFYPVYVNTELLKKGIDILIKYLKK